MTTSSANPLHIPDAKVETPPPDEQWFLVRVRLRRINFHVVAQCQHLPECMEYGCTIDEALANIKAALHGCLEAYLATGPIPWLPESDVPARQPFEEERSVLIVVKRRKS